jgi:hypothetical protein
MSISALSSTLVADLSQHRQNPFRQIRQDFRELASAVQSGDLPDAQAAYSSIEQLLQANQTASDGNASSNGPNTLQSDFAALGQALQAGDLTGAQGALSQLQSDSQAARSSRSAGAAAPPPVQDQYVPSAPQPHNPAQQIRQDYAQLATALQSSDLAQAQSAFSQLRSDFQAVRQSRGAGGQNPVQQVRQDYAQLANALESGDLTSAQSAFAALQQALQTQTGPSETGPITTAPNTAPNTDSTNGADPILNDFNAVGQALTSGDLAGAQSAFAQLKSDIQAVEQTAAGQPQSPGLAGKQVRQDYTQLASALASGDLTGAQSAFADLQQALQAQTGSNNSTPATAPTTDSTSSADPILNAFNALGQALSSGDLTQAQAAFAQLQSDIQAAESPAQGFSQGLKALVQGHHHHHHRDGGPGGQSSIPPAASPYTSTASDNGVTVNIYVYA